MNETGDVFIDFHASFNQPPEIGTGDLKNHFLIRNSGGDNAHIDSLLGGIRKCDDHLVIKYQFRYIIEMIWYRVWNAGLLLWWYRLWIRNDEFHHSLDIDVQAMLTMDREQKERYLDDLSRRRRIAHERDLDEE